MADDSFDAVTCLEVLEHIPDWQATLRELARVCRRTLLVSVPYRQPVLMQICMHCHKPTPSAGHLHMFSEDSFGTLGDNRPRFAYMLRPGMGTVRRVWHRAKHHWAWMMVRYDLR